MQVSHQWLHKHNGLSGVLAQQARMQTHTPLTRVNSGFDIVTDLQPKIRVSL